MRFRLIVGFLTGVCAAVYGSGAKAQLVTSEMRSQIGDNSYLEHALNGAERELRRYGAGRSGWHTFSATAGGTGTVYNVPASGLGYIAVGGDQDTGQICLYPYIGGFLNTINASCGQNTAILTLPEGGRFQVRVEITDCRTSFCYFAVLTGY